MIKSKAECLNLNARMREHASIWP